MSPNRIVALVTPIAALAAGACATWLAEHFPGIDIKQSDLPVDAARHPIS